MDLDAKSRVIIAVCTYRRNAELDHLLTTIVQYAAENWAACEVGMTVIDDSPDGQAKQVVEKFADAFPLEIVYENTASRNISVARNSALANSTSRGDWIAMTDDDCEPSKDWLSELVRVQTETDADVVTGLMVRRAPEHAPRWLKEQPFLELGEFGGRDGDELPVAQTNNSLVSTSFLRAHTDLRFDPAFGRIGGEDMAFFHALKNLGGKIVFAANAFVYENEPDERLTRRYQLRRYYWHGNTSAHTSFRKGNSRPRFLVHAVATMARAVIRPISQVSKGSKPQFLYALAKLLEGLGKLAGVLGIKVSHK